MTNETTIPGLQQTFDLLHDINGLPGYVLVLLLCWVAGFIMKRVRQIPNESIPIAIVLLGGLMNVLLAPPRAQGEIVRLWVMRNIIVGIIIGFIAWAAHRFLFKSILGRFLPASEDDALQEPSKPVDPQSNSSTKQPTP